MKPGQTVVNPGRGNPGRAPGYPAVGKFPNDIRQIKAGHRLL